LDDAQFLGSFATPWRDFANRAAEREAKRAAVLQVAVEMFVARGYGRTKLADIASQLKTTEAALYTYFDSKEAILVECYRLGDLAVREGVASAEATSGVGLERCSVLSAAIARS